MDPIGGAAPDCGLAAAAAEGPSAGERDQVVADVVHLVDAGLLDADRAGHLLSAVHRAATRRELRAVTGELTADRDTALARRRRAQRWRAGVVLAVCALASVILLAAVLYGLSPTDPH